MVTGEEIERAVERLKEAGLWAEFKVISRQTIERSANSVLFHGFGEEPKPNPDDPNSWVMPLPKGWFSIWYWDFGSTYSAIIPLGQISVSIKESAHFDEIITAIIHYFEIKKAVPNPERMRWVSVTDPENGLINTIHWLQSAGASIEILTGNLMQVSFSNRVYTMQFDNNDFSGIKLEGADRGANNLEDAILTILAHQCKLLSAKLQPS